MCGVYRDGAQPHTKKAFEKAYKIALTGLVRVPRSWRPLWSGEIQLLKSRGMTDDQIRKELEEQARQYACAEHLKALDDAKASSGESGGGAAVAEQAFEACVSARTTDAEVQDYKDVYRKGLAAHYASRAQQGACSNATRIHFSFGGM